jgi:hypothetical protein
MNMLLISGSQAVGMDPMSIRVAIIDDDRALLDSTAASGEGRYARSGRASRQEPSQTAHRRRWIHSGRSRG